MRIEELKLTGDVLGRMAAIALVVSLDGRILSANRAAEKAFGFSQDQLETMGLEGLRDGDERAFIADQMQHAAANGTHFETAHRRSDGSCFRAETHAMPVTIADKPALLAIIDDITERTLAEAAIAASERRLSTILRTSPDGILILRLSDGVCLEANDRFAELTGFARGELIGFRTANFHMWRHPADRMRFFEALEIAEGMSGYEVEFVRKDGSVWDALVSANHIEIDGANCVIAVNTDVTDLKSVQRRVERLNRVYAVLSGVNQALVKIRDPQAIFDEACRVIVEEGGFRMAWVGLVDSDGVSVRPVAHAGDGAGYLESVDIVLGDERRGRGPVGQAISGRRHMVSQDIGQNPQMAPWRTSAAEYGYRSCAAFPLTLNGEAIGAFNIYSAESRFFGNEEIHLLDELAADISLALEFHEKEERRHRAEAALDKSEERYRLLSQSSDDFIWELDQVGVITFMSPQVLNVLGFEPEELLGKIPFDLMPPEEAARVYDDFASVYGSGVPFRNFQFVSRRKDGTLVPAEVSGVPFFDDAGNVRGYLGTCRDITARKQAEETMMRSNESLRGLLEIVSHPEQFDADVAAACELLHKAGLLDD